MALATVTSIVSLLVAAYLVVLGISAFVRPDLVKRFFGLFANTARQHYTEVTLRLVAGAALVAQSPRMQSGGAVAVFGWVVLVTTLGMALVPWRVHQRFAARVMPRLFRLLPLVGGIALLAGLALLAALLLPGRAA